MRLLRKVSVAKWKECIRRGADYITADAITGCLRTQGNTLSLWCSSTEDEMQHSILALSTSLNKIDTISYIELDSEALEGDDLKLVSTDGQSAAPAYNQLHRDLVDLDNLALSRVAAHVKAKIEADDFKTLTKADIRAILIRGLSRGEVEESLLDKKLREELEKVKLNQKGA